MILACHITMWSSLFIIIPYSISSFFFCLFIFLLKKKKKNVDWENLTYPLKWNSTSCANIVLIWKLLLQHSILWHYILFLFHCIYVSLCMAVNNLGWISLIWLPMTRKTYFLLYVDLFNTSRCCSQEHTVYLSVTENCSGWYFPWGMWEMHCFSLSESVVFSFL